MASVSSACRVSQEACRRGCRSHWAVSAWTPAHSGSRLRTAGHDRRIVGQEIWRAATVGDTTGLWKSAGMLALSPAGAAALGVALGDEAADGRRNIYYDDVIGRHLDAVPLDVLDLGDAPWVEIDDLADLAEARRQFEEPRR